MRERACVAVVEWGWLQGWRGLGCMKAWCGEERGYDAGPHEALRMPRCGVTSVRYLILPLLYVFEVLLTICLFLPFLSFLFPLLFTCQWVRAGARACLLASPCRSQAWGSASAACPQTLLPSCG